MADGPDEAPTDGTPDAPPVETTTGAAPSERARDPLLLALIGLAVAVLLFLAAAIPVLRDRDGGTDESVTASGSTTSVADEAVTSAPDPTAPDEPAGGATTTTVSAADEPATSVSNGVPDSTPATSAPDDATTPTGATGTAAGATTTTNPQRTGTAAGGDDVPESIAVVQGGKIYLSGAVPDQESMIRIVALAGEVLGPENVINDYFIDPRASDPNLGNVRVDDNILFESGTATIAREFEPLLNQALVLMTIRPSVTMHVVGHTDDRGSVEDNQDLSERRAEAVVRWLTDRGIDPARLTSEGRGELEPVATNDTEAGRALNRRIQVFIANLLSADVVEDALSNG